MTDEELSLIEAIHANPRSDQPRLCYAGWLDGHGAPDYAEFIRLQCEQPYVVISTRDEPHLSLSYDFPFEDISANQRLKRIIELYPRLLASERFSPFRQDYYYQEFRRGIALWEVDDLDFATTQSGQNPLITATPHLLRFKLCIEVTAKDLACCFNNPILRKVDVLRIAVHGEWDGFQIHADTDLSEVDFSHLSFVEEVNLARCPSPLREQILAVAGWYNVRFDDDDWSR